MIYASDFLWIYWGGMPSEMIPYTKKAIIGALQSPKSTVIMGIAWDDPDGLVINSNITQDR